MIKDKFQKALKHLIIVFDKELAQPLKTLKDKLIEEKQRWQIIFNAIISKSRRESNLDNKNTIKIYQSEIKKGTKPRPRTKKSKKETEDLIKEFGLLQIDEPKPNDDLKELKLNLMIIVRTEFRNQDYTYNLIKQFVDQQAQKNIVILQEIKEWLVAQDLASNKQIDSWMLDVMLNLNVDLIITKTNLESFDRIKGLVKNCYHKVVDNSEDIILLSKKTQINNFIGMDEEAVFYPKNYQSFIMQISGMSEKKAIAICKRFKTLRILVEYIKSLPLYDWSSIACIDVKKLDNKKHVIGDKLARALYMLFTSDNYMQYLYQN